MSSLRFSEKNLLEKIFGMRTGYVSDFSDRNLREFVLDQTEIDIFTPEYEENGTSKANRIRTFWNRQSDEVNADLIDALLRYAEREKTEHDRDLSAGDIHAFVEARKIVQKLRDEPDSPPPHSRIQPASGLVIEAAGDINNSGHVKAQEGQVVAMRSLGNVNHSGKIEFIGEKKPERDLVEKITNNATFSTVVGTLFLAVVLYGIYFFSGVNLAQFK